MINHARTLLLNEINKGTPAPWDRYMPEEFRPIELPEWLEVVRSTLVPAGSWFDKTYSVELLLTVMASYKFAFATQWIDRRVTPPQVLPFHATYGTTVTSGLIPDTVFSGVISRPTTATRPIIRSWSIRAVADEEVVIKDISGGTPGRTANLVNGIVALDADISLSFNAPLPFGAIWRVETLTRPEPRVAQYPSVIGTIPLDVSAKLFRPQEPGDELLSTYTGWVKEGQPEGIIAAYALAYVFQATKLIK